MVKRAGLERMLDGVGSYTLFAPTDAAIAALPEADRQRLSSDAGRPQLIAMLRQHLAPGYIGAADMEQGLARQNAASRWQRSGEPIAVRRVGTTVVFGPGDDAPKLTGRPIDARNGVVFPIDRVLPPPTAR
ncbi:fasciclin domain-containing protein [Sphingomonas sp. MMS24-JH45]